MASPKYFSYLPNIDYPVRMNRAGLVDTLKVKDFFHLMKIREDLFDDETLYEPYYIENGERPDQVSYGFYGDAQYYWVILQTNDIVDVYQDWPLSSWELDEYVLKKYGSHEKAGETHHYETITTYDDEGNLVLPGRGMPGPDRGGLAQNGLRVSENYTFTYPTYPGSAEYVTLSGSSGVRPACTPVSNRQFEFNVNQDKSQIWILQEKYLPDYVREVQNYYGSIKSSDLSTELNLSDID